MSLSHRRSRSCLIDHISDLISHSERATDFPSRARKKFVECSTIGSRFASLTEDTAKTPVAASRVRGQGIWIEGDSTL